MNLAWILPGALLQGLDYNPAVLRFIEGNGKKRVAFLCEANILSRKGLAIVPVQPFFAVFKLKHKM